ncbi:dioxygenase family protein [Hydrogenophaga pseudoflava]|uniref:dioxygenase family protein n=1 Tax=Hydrogenophaga pseudoflava TaxID=47421 RepID=UPI0027E57876|nr:dioxygenase [Hydrogenophaga pseudoflava]MDQ7747270.1 dioxygenase [Hydrogenophaga pseudoflava]
MNNPGSDALLQQVADSFAATPDPRLREILASLVRHLHGFIRETGLTEREWMQGIEFLTAVGQTCDDKRQEFILLSDVLGASMQVVAVQSERPAGCTESTVFGPFHVEGASRIANGGDIANGARGEPCTVFGSVRNSDGDPVADAEVDVWQSDDDGLYDVQRPGLPAAQGRGVLRTDAQGRFWFTSVVPVPYPIPTDGPVGRLLDASRRSAWRPAHLHVRIVAPGHDTLITHVFRAGDPHLESDPVFGVRPSLVSSWPGSAEGRRELRFDFVLHRHEAP